MRAAAPSRRVEVKNKTKKDALVSSFRHYHKMYCLISVFGFRNCEKGMGGRRRRFKLAEGKLRCSDEIDAFGMKIELFNGWLLIVSFLERRLSSKWLDFYVGLKRSQIPLSLPVVFYGISVYFDGNWFCGVVFQIS